MGPVFALLAIIIFCWSIVGLIAPRKLKFPNRSWAFSAFLFSFVLVGIGMYVDPGEEAEAAGSDFPVGLTLIWLLASSTLLCRQRILAKLRKRENRASQKAEQGAKAGKFDAARKVDDEISALKRMAANRKASSITSSHFETGHFAASQHSSPPPLDFSSKSKKRSSRAGSIKGKWGPILQRRTDGVPLSFEYVDAHGEITNRLIFNWVEYPNYIEGVCAEVNSARTFRKDRVNAWHAQSDSYLLEP